MEKDRLHVVAEWRETAGLLVQERPRPFVKIRVAFSEPMPWPCARLRDRKGDLLDYWPRMLRVEVPNSGNATNPLDKV